MNLLAIFAGHFSMFCIQLGLNKCTKMTMKTYKLCVLSKVRQTTAPPVFGDGKCLVA